MSKVKKKKTEVFRVPNRVEPWIRQGKRTYQRRRRSWTAAGPEAVRAARVEEDVCGCPPPARGCGGGGATRDLAVRHRRRRRRRGRARVGPREKTVGRAVRQPRSEPSGIPNQKTKKARYFFHLLSVSDLTFCLKRLVGWVVWMWSTKVWMLGLGKNISKFEHLFVLSIFKICQMHLIR